MPYSDFSLGRVAKEFQLHIVEGEGLFTDIPPRKCSDLLRETLRYNVPLAIANNTEKARSELIISPILLEARRQKQAQQQHFNFFSGVRFDIDESRGLNGFCDFIVTRSSELLYITAPVIMLVEAKNENIFNGIGQCIAEMIAAQIFNQQENKENQENNPHDTSNAIFGIVTTGTIWQFIRLENQEVRIDLREYHIRHENDLEHILGFLTQ